jgi:hypothetical protein
MDRLQELKTNEDDKIERTKALFIQVESLDFKYKQFWEILKNKFKFMKIVFCILNLNTRQLRKRPSKHWI